MVVLTVQPGQVRRIAVSLAAALILLVPLVAGGQSKKEVAVAAAANLTDAFKQLGPRFEAETGIHPVFIFASTGQLSQQIESLAPFDVFASADTQHVAGLNRKALLLPHTSAVFARGVLALWIPPGAKTAVRRIEDLLSPDVRIIAIAKPELAPYGEAAVSALKRAGVWEQVKSKIVYAENINMAKQYGASGNADAVFCAYPLVLHDSGIVLRIDTGLYPRIDQTLAITANAEHKDAARLFVEFLLRGRGREVLESYGYQLPDRVR